MRLRVQKWGNSLALRIPKAFAQEARVGQGTVVNLSMAKGKLVIEPVAEKQVSLAQLLVGITRKNLHRESEFGGAVGREVW
jgi:antitoxin MazE